MHTKQLNSLDAILMNFDNLITLTRQITKLDSKQFTSVSTNITRFDDNPEICGGVFSHTLCENHNEHC